jgi:ABC-type nitrate/sulfonate/bicarbonate transport system ATPase subunit/ABC-type transporter Mla MlaB component
VSVLPTALIADDGHAEVLGLSGTLTFVEAAPSWVRWRASLEQLRPGQRFDFDMSRVEVIDGGSMALLVALRAELHRRGVRSEFIGAPQAVQRLIQLYSGDVKVGPLPQRRAPGLLDQLGSSTLSVLVGFREVFGFFGDALVALGTVVRRPRSANWKELWPTIEKTGADAVPIVMLINFLIGLVMGFQGAVQLKQFGVMFQSGALLGSMTVAENLALQLTEWSDLTPDAVSAIVRAKLRLVGLQGVEDKLPNELSGGMKKRVAIARAMVLEPTLLFLDEPSAGLDPVNSFELDALILSLNQGLGLTVVMVSHELESIFAIGSRCIMLDRESKRIIANGAPHALRTSADDPRVSAFFNRRAAPAPAPRPSVPEVTP